MTDRLKKEDFVRLLAARMHADEATATAWVDGVVETLYEPMERISVYAALLADH